MSTNDVIWDPSKLTKSDKKELYMMGCLDYSIEDNEKVVETYSIDALSDYYVKDLMIERPRVRELLFKKLINNGMNETEARYKAFK